MPIDPTVRAAAIHQRHAMVASPVLDRLRADAEVWSAVVYWDAYPEQVGRETLDAELSRIKACGFQAVRFHKIGPRYLGHGQWDHSTGERWIQAAERAGLAVIVCGEVYQTPPAELLAEHGIDQQTYRGGWFDDAASQAVLAAYVAAYIGHWRGRVAAWCVLGEPNPPVADLTNSAEAERFETWLRQRYASLAAVSAAWRTYPSQPHLEQWADAVALAAPTQARQINGVENAGKLYGAARDLQAFLADRECRRAEVIAEQVAAADPAVPVGVGSHQLFVNQAHLGWDIGRWARAGTLHTTSIHLSWHFESVAGEVDLPVYLQARQTRDYLKSGFTSAFETTGGAVQYSGGYGNHMDVGLMRRLCLNYLAAGNQSMAFWSWNHRPGGWEQGEYGMLGLSGAVMPWAEEAGRIAQAMEHHAGELWQDATHRSVGVVESWDTDGVLIKEPPRHGSDLVGDQRIPGAIHGGTPAQHRQALVGAGRICTQGQLDWEYLTLSELRAGLAGCYDSLLLPFHRALDPELIEPLQAYVAAGGRVIADLQIGFCDPCGRLLPRGVESPLGQLFGAWVETIHDSRTGGPQWQGRDLVGHWADLGVASATVIATFDDGRPAVTSQRHGQGEALLIACDPAGAAAGPGADWASGLLTPLLRTRPAAWTSSLSQTMRRTTPTADHYFFINPGPATTAWVHSERAYTSLAAVLDGDQPQAIAGGFAVSVPAASAQWVRASRGAG